MVYLHTELDMPTSITSLPSNQKLNRAYRRIFRMIAMLLFYILEENCLKLLPTTYVCRLEPEIQSYYTYIHIHGLMCWNTIQFTIH
jgi:hypothetical protein